MCGPFVFLLAVDRSFWRVRVCFGPAGAEIPRLRSGFRLRALTPAKRLKLSPAGPMILRWQRHGKVGRCQDWIGDGPNSHLRVRPVLLWLLASARSCTMTLMKVMDFKVFLEPDQEYGGYVVTCPSIPGCHSQGKSVEEALANIREAIELCLEVMRERGEDLPDPNGTLIGSVVVTQ